MRPQATASGAEPTARSDHRPQLSPAQERILQLIGDGKNTRQIALIMGVSEKGIEYHRGRIYAILGLKCVADAVRAAWRSRVKL